MVYIGEEGRRDNEYFTATSKVEVYIGNRLTATNWIDFAGEMSVSTGMMARAGKSPYQLNETQSQA